MKAKQKVALHTVPPPFVLDKKRNRVNEDRRREAIQEHLSSGKLKNL